MLGEILERLKRESTDPDMHLFQLFDVLKRQRKAMNMLYRYRRIVFIEYIFYTASRRKRKRDRRYASQFYHSPTLPMKTRTALTIGVIGTAGAAATYLYNRPKLRKEMMKADSAQEAAALFTEQIEKDAADVAKSMKKKAMHNWLMDELRSSGKAIKKRITKVKSHAKADVKAVKREGKAMLSEMKQEKAHVERKLRETAKKSAEAVAEKATA